MAYSTLPKVKGAAMGINYGFDRVRFLHRVRSGSRVRAHFLLTAVLKRSEREWQLEHGGQWVKGKSFDTFGPIGPWLVTADEIRDPQNLAMWLDLNGKRMQTGNTSTMIFGVRKLVSYLSYCMTLLPGDIVAVAAQPPEGTHPNAGAAAIRALPLPAGATRQMVELGERIYRGQAGGAACTGCHGDNGQGTPLGPSLKGKKWLWSDGSYAGIKKTITAGVSQPKQYRSPMPPMGGAQFTPDQISAVAAYVWSLSHHASSNHN